MMNGIINACSVITRGKNIVIHFILVLQFITFDWEYIRDYTNASSIFINKS